MKRKDGVYLPLVWCKSLKKQMQEIIGEEVSTEDVLNFVNIIQRDNSEAQEAINTFCMKYPKFKNVITSIFMLDRIRRISAKESWQETIKDIMSFVNVSSWSNNKQVFKFDKDFLEELVRTENLSINENAWDYLPYTSFYVDISDSQELCRQLAGEGVFVTVRKLPAEKVIWKEGQKPTETAYEVLLCKVDKKYFYTDTITVPNANYDCTLDGGEETPIERHDIKREKDGRFSSIKTTTVVNTKAYQTIIVQILNYLASVEPDISENAETKKTYRQPKQDNHSIVKTTVQDKFSEIRKWDVGVRFGTAYRRWKAEEKSGVERGANGKHTGKRPHSRKAHWHHFWYGSGENKVCRPKWLNQTFINADKQEQAGSPVTIHQCS